MKTSIRLQVARSDKVDDAFPALDPFGIHRRRDREGRSGQLHDQTSPLPANPCRRPCNRTAALRGPVPTNQWWSSLVWKPFSPNLFAHPLGMVCVPEGLAVAYPEPRSRVAGATSWRGGIGAGDLVIAIPASRRSRGPIATERRTGSSMSGSRKERNNSGFPSAWQSVVFARHAGGDPVVRFAERRRSGSAASGDAVLGVIRAAGSIIVSSVRRLALDRCVGQQSSLSPVDGITSASPLLPDRETGDPRSFRGLRASPCYGHRLVPRVEAGRVVNEYQFQTKAMEGTGNGTLFALYPHQWKYTADPLTPWTYGSVRGTMKVGEGDSFKTVVTVQGVAAPFAGRGPCDRDCHDRVAEAGGGTGPGRLRGHVLGRASTSASSPTSPESRKPPATWPCAPLSWRRSDGRLENWFTASPEEDSPCSNTIRTGGP